MKDQHTYNRLPKDFLFLPKDFLSNSISLNPHDFDDLNIFECLLNNYNKEDFGHSWQDSSVLRYSIFRNHQHEFKCFLSLGGS